MRKRYLQYFSSRTKGFQRISAGLVVLAVAITGTILLTGSHAATPYASINADTGTLAGGATKQTCSGASNGNCVTFGSNTAACTTTLNSGDNVATAIIAAKDGDMVCLNTGSYPNMTVNGAVHSSYVTIRPVSGATVTMAGLRIANSSFLRFQGLTMTAGFDAQDGPSGVSHDLQFINNDITGLYGVVVYGSSAPITHVLIQGNNIHDLDTGSCSNLPTGLAWDTGVQNDYGDDIIISHNTFKSVSWHYIQGGGGSLGMTVDHNLFEGSIPAGWASCTHLNIWQIFNGSSNDTFSNNIVQGTSGSPASVTPILFENGPAGADCTQKFTNITIDNNLFAYASAAYDVQLLTATNLKYTNNTSIGSTYGVWLDRSCGTVPPDTPTAGTDATITNNITVQNGGHTPDMEFDACNGTCTYDYNVTSDSSANSDGSTHYVANWTPSWQNTTWTPGSGPPPAGYYQPAGLPFAAGYQGSIGP